MSPDDSTSRLIRTLVAELRDDLDAIARLLERIEQIRSRIGDDATPDPGDVMAVAGFIHHVYTAMESMHERIAANVDRVPPSGERWHHELLARMGIELTGIRPAVLRSNTRAQLSRLLRFRHFFRHAYRIDLLWVELRPLAGDVTAIVAEYRDDLEAFIAHLEAVSTA